MRVVFTDLFFSLLCGRVGGHFTEPRLLGEVVRSFAQVTQSGEARGFKDPRLGLTGETHSGVLWAGWTLLFLPDIKGRLGVVRIVGPNNTPAKEFALSYDGASWLSGNTTRELAASYGGRVARS